MQKEKWSKSNNINLTIESIKFKLNAIIESQDTMGQDMQRFKQFKKQYVDNMEQGFIKDGATKEVNAIIKSFKQQSSKYKINDKQLDYFTIIINEWINDSNLDIHKRLFTIFNRVNISSSKGFATFDCIELIGYKIVGQLVTTQYFLNLHKDGRFMRDKREQDIKIKQLNKTIQLAHTYNNHHLLNELENMLKQIKKEDTITKDIIIKSCFYSIHKILIDEGNFWNNEQALARETQAKDISNQLIMDFFDLTLEDGYKPSKNEGQKIFYEQGSNDPRIFYYYKSK